MHALACMLVHERYSRLGKNWTASAVAINSLQLKVAAAGILEIVAAARVKKVK